MTNLTEKWKKGELENGHYWIKMSYQGAIIPLYYSEDYGFEYDDHFYDFEEISEVLDKVPSYEQWKSSDKLILTLMDNIKDKSDLLQLAIVKNVELKELLKECELWFTGIVGNINDKNVGEHNRNIPIGNFEHAFRAFSQKINQVLGEE